MVGLAWKDALVVLRDQWKFYAAALAAMMFIPFWDGALGAFPGLLGMLMVFIPTNACANDTLARWDHFAPCTPAGREGVVAGKYLFALWLSLLGAALLLAYYPIWCLITGTLAVLPGLLCSAGTCGLIYLLMDALLIPLSFHFGAERNSLGISALGLPSLFLASGTASAALGQPNPFSIPFFLALVLAVIFVPLSFQLSVALYRRKDL